MALYIDGFNLYHAINDQRRPHLKWVNLWGLGETLAYANETLVSVRYFSAFAHWLPGPYSRHREFVAAQEAHGVDCVMAHFKEKHMECRGCQRTWIEHEEKESDVHLALRLLADSEDEIFDRAILLTADSDLVPVVRMVKARHIRVHLTVAAPPGRFNAGRHLQQVSDSYFAVSRGKLGRNILPAEIRDANGNVVARRPVEYAPPAGY